MNEYVLVARKRKKLSQLALAEACGCQQPDISRIEGDGWVPPPALQDKLAEALDTTVDVLFGQQAVRAS